MALRACFYVVAKATTHKDLRRERSGCTPNTRPGRAGLNAVPRTLCKLREGTRHPQNLKAVACLGYKGGPHA